MFKADIESASVDFVYDSGLFHHLPPHRRILYYELINRILKPDMYFGLTCFAAGKNAAPEVDDWEYYKENRVGIAFTEKRLIDFWGRGFDIIGIRPYRDGVDGTIQGLSMMWTCLFRKN